MLTRRQVLIAVTSAATSAVVRGEAKAAAAVPQPATPVRFTVPEGACDTHTHVFGDQERFPYASTSRYRHPPATPDDLQMLLRALHVDRVVIIQPSGYATDNSCTLDGVRRLGSRARGVVAIADNTSDTALDDMDGEGVRGIRVNIGQTLEDARPRLDASSPAGGRPRLACQHRPQATDARGTSAAVFGISGADRHRPFRRISSVPRRAATGLRCPAGPPANRQDLPQSVESPQHFHGGARLRGRCAAGPGADCRKSATYSVGHRLATRRGAAARILSYRHLAVQGDR